MVITNKKSRKKKPLFIEIRYVALENLNLSKVPFNAEYLDPKQNRIFTGTLVINDQFG